MSLTIAAVTYGERFRQLRHRLFKPPLRVIDLARRLGKDHPQVIYGIEARWRVPNLDTIQEHAAALGVDPWELLEGVETEYDRARALNKLKPAEAKSAWTLLMRDYEASKRGTGTFAHREQQAARRKQHHARAGSKAS